MAGVVSRGLDGPGILRPAADRPEQFDFYARDRLAAVAVDHLAAGGEALLELDLERRLRIDRDGAHAQALCVETGSHRQVVGADLRVDVSERESPFAIGAR